MRINEAGTILLNLRTKQIALVYTENSGHLTFPIGTVKNKETAQDCAVRITKEKTLKDNHLLLTQPIFIFQYLTSSNQLHECSIYISIDNNPTVTNATSNLKLVTLDEVENFLSDNYLKEKWNTIKRPINDLLNNGGTLSPAMLTDLGICSTCYDRDNNNCIYGDKSDKTLFTNDEFECFFVGNPRSPGHVAILSKKHYKDMLEIPDDLCSHIFVFAKIMMQILKKVYHAESIYLCTMCDGPMNHFHIQLIPRYSYEKRGSSNFVKPRLNYIEDKGKIQSIKEMLHTIQRSE